MKRTILLLWASTFGVGCIHARHHQPPAEMLMHPGPGVGGPGPGVMSGQPLSQVPSGPAQVFFAGPEGMQLAWESGGPGQFSPAQLTAPARYNFPQGSLFRLKLTGIPGRPGMELYPTLEVAPGSPKTEAYLSHNPIPISFSSEDIDQILSGNYVTKVVFLPDPQHQELAIAGVETLVSTRLEPGANPLVEADRRGTILAVLRAGNIDLEMPGSNGLSMTAPQSPIHLTGGAIPAPGYPGAAPTVMPTSGAYASHSVFSGGCANGECGETHSMIQPAGPGYPMTQNTGPSWGIPMTGTPIGLPGPPHIPLGGQAGLQQHTMHNRTRHFIPRPTKRLTVNVKHKPGISIPRPVRSVHITENNGHWPF